MAKIQITYFAAHKNARFLEIYENARQTFIDEIPDNLKNAIKIVSDNVWNLKQGNPGVNSTNVLHELLRPGSIPVPGSAFLDNQPALAAMPPATEIQRSYQILHWLQRKLQRLWLIKLDEMAAARIKKIIDYYGSPSADTLLIFTLPEFYFTYLPDFGHSAAKIPAPAAGNPNPDYVRNYSKPFYSDTLDVLLHGRDVSDNSERPLSLKKLGEKSNVIILAGTVRWKNIENDHSNEIIYNTLPIFSNRHRDPYLWSKITTSDIDGNASLGLTGGFRLNADGSNGAAIIRHKKEPAIQRDIANCPPPRNNHQVQVLTVPLFPYTLSRMNPPVTIPIGIDICLDHMRYPQNLAAGHNPNLFRGSFLNQSVPSTGTAVAIHVLIAAGMGKEFEHPDAQAFLVNDGGTRSKEAFGSDTEAFVRSAGVWSPKSLSRANAKTSLFGHSEWFQQFNEFEISI
jgi:hypothetical protein